MKFVRPFFCSLGEAQGAGGLSQDLRSEEGDFGGGNNQAGSPQASDPRMGSETKAVKIIDQWSWEWSQEPKFGL